MHNKIWDREYGYKALWERKVGNSWMAYLDQERIIWLDLTDYGEIIGIGS